MLVYEFMVPHDKVVTCAPHESINAVIAQFLDKKLSAVVVLNPDGGEPIGIITKTDIARAYKKGLPLTEPVEGVMSTGLQTVNRAMSHDDAASVFTKHKVHHAVVVDDSGKFVGFISAWDVAREGYLDSKAWPWNRNALA